MHDYRYFPEPDLVPVAPTEEMLERARAALPELPAARARALRARDSGCREDTRRSCSRSERAGRLLRGALRRAADAAAGAGAGELDDRRAGRALGEGEDPRESQGAAGGARGAGAAWSAAQALSRRRAKEVLAELVAESGGDPAAIVEARGPGARCADGGELDAIVERAIEPNPAAVEQIKAGNAKACARSCAAPTCASATSRARAPTAAACTSARWRATTRRSPTTT